MEIFVGIMNRMPFVTVEGKPRSTASLDMDFIESASSVDAVFSSQAHLTPSRLQMIGPKNATSSQTIPGCSTRTPPIGFRT
jgi:hypothetical protein